MKHWRITLVALFAVCATPFAGAQTLNFDEVCGSPPCNSGTAYLASWGVTVAPATTPIVSNGTNGLSGTNGGAYLSLNAFPYQGTITLPRTATFASVDVSRSNLTAVGQTFTLQALSNGVPVGAPQTVTLGSLNSWTTVTVSVPGGFNGLFLDTAGGSVNKTFGVDNIRLAGNCAGFTDVAPSDSFCNAAEWLYNRGVTTGCTLGAYCPLSNVTRAQMALFMQRLGTALSPVVYPSLSQSFSNSLASEYFCGMGAAVPADIRPRVATAIGNVMIDSVTSLPRNIRAVVTYTADDGATWWYLPGSEYTYANVTAAGVYTITAFGGPLTLQPGSTYRFGVALSNWTGSGTVTGFCSAQATVLPATSTSAPFDVAPSAPSTGVSVTN